MSSSNLSLRNSSAICLANPKAAEIECTWKLREYLMESDVFETQDELDHRIEVLAQLQSLVKSWIRYVSINRKNLPSVAADTVGGKLYTFGSYRLGVVSEDTEIDAICLAPCHVKRSDFFNSFYQVLVDQQQVSHLKAEDDVFIKMRFDGIEINLFYARLPLNEINEDVDLMDNNILTYLDDMCAKSFNACRVTNAILQSVPNIESFRLTLRAVKLWAKRHGVYNNDYGYLGGVSWAIMVARVCQLFPNACAATLLEKFFLVFSVWTWPRPVNLTIPIDVQLGFKVWDPEINFRDSTDAMPIITPCYPYLNSAFRITPSSRGVMLDEFAMSANISEDVMRGRANWKTLFQPTNFFTKYRRYLLVVAYAATPQNQQKWCEFVKSRLRFLLLTLELNPLIKTVRITPRIFSCCHEEFKGTPHSCWFLGLDFGMNENRSVDLQVNINAFFQKIYRESVSTGIYQDGMQVSCQFMMRSHLPMYVSQEDLDSYEPKDDKAQHRQRLEMRVAPAG